MVGSGDVMIRFVRQLVWRAALFACLGGPVMAASIVGSFTWDNVGDVEGWTAPGQDWVTLGNPGTGGPGGEGDGFLKIDMAATPGFPSEGSFALARTPASALFAGTWESDMWVEFDFWAQDVEPEYVEVRWAGDDGSVWRSTVFDSDESTMQTETWSQLSSASFTDYADWDYGGGNQEDFVNDLASIDWIGVYVWRSGGDAQRYGIDNFNLMVPEPEEYVMMFASALVILLSIGRRRDGRAWLPIRSG